MLFETDIENSRRVSKQTEIMCVASHTPFYFPMLHLNLFQITGKLPGFLDPNTKLAFADIPNGLAAISKVHSLAILHNSCHPHRFK